MKRNIIILITVSVLFVLAISTGILTVSAALFQEDEDLRTEYETEHYDVNFSTMMDEQMEAGGALPQTDSGNEWYDASEALTAYYINPKNFEKDSSDFFQFMKLSSSSEVSTEQLNEDILKGKGELTGKANTFKQASEKHGVNEIYLISHALHETGGGTSGLAEGVEVGEDKKGEPTLAESSNQDKLDHINTVYNFFGVNATDDDPVKNGAKHAYEQGWFTPDDAIAGGAAYVKDNYISGGQDTLYKMRWDPDHSGENQYATDVGWAVKQTDDIKHVYDMLEDRDDALITFEIPAFNNQPESAEKPEGAEVFYVDQAGDDAEEDTEGEIKKKDHQLREGPTSDFPEVTTLSEETKVDIIGENTGWYKVEKDKQQGWVPSDDIKVKE